MTAKKKAKAAKAKAPAKKPAAAPKGQLARLVERLFQLQRDKRLAQQRVDRLDDERKTLEDEVLQGFTVDELSAVRTKSGQATRVATVVPQAEDWEKIYAWIKETGRFELLNKRLTAEVWHEQQEAGRPVPGTVPFTRVSLKLTSTK